MRHLAFLLIVFASSTFALPSTNPSPDRIPASWNATNIARDALIGREKDAAKDYPFKARILLWKIYGDDRPLHAESCIVWLEFQSLEGHTLQRLANMCHYGRNGGPDDRWALSEVLDAVHSSHADYEKAPTNDQVYAFLKDTWWRFDFEPYFITLDSNVCTTAWKEITGSEPTKVFSPTQPILPGHGELESAPHGKGNTYGPDVHFDNGVYRMWYGAQGKDGHDRILYAESAEGLRWVRKGLALQDSTANHVNDPSVVKVGDTYYMYFTRAGKGVTDAIALATSPDGLKWTLRGVVISPGKDGEWDSLSVGRPSVLHEGNLFKLWYDGRKDLPLNAPDPTAKKSATSGRSVGYATSPDGLHWTKHPTNPVFGHDSGGVDVKRIGNQYLMACESHRGTRVATSPDGITWLNRSLWIKMSGSDYDAFGQVTPCLFVDPQTKSIRLYFGAASAAAWDQNIIAVHTVAADELESLTRPSPK